MNIYGCFTPEINHMLLFGKFWHAITRSLDREKMTPRDMDKETLRQSGNRDILGSKCGIRVCTFMHFKVWGSRQRCNKPHWRDKQIYLEREYLVSMINPLT